MRQQTVTHRQLNDCANELILWHDGNLSRADALSIARAAARAFDLKLEVLPTPSPARSHGTLEAYLAQGTGRA
jgi:hypothetical protein